MAYTEEEFLLLSGIQHFCFCRRQWALIHVEQQWRENLKTTEGMFNHERCHDDKFEEKRNDLLITRGLRVVSRELGVTGACDVVEFHASEQGAVLAKRTGIWQPYPIEYKHGKSKSIDADRLQLCCQAMCLEEMLSCNIDKGALFYEETHRREEVFFSRELRETVSNMLKEMHGYFHRGYTPKSKITSGCKSCSLKDICLPQLTKSKSTESYYKSYMNEETT